MQAVQGFFEKMSARFTPLSSAHTPTSTTSSSKLASRKSACSGTPTSIEELIELDQEEEEQEDVHDLVDDDNDDNSKNEKVRQKCINPSFLRSLAWTSTEM